jgi:ribulose-phosphate 3-epimerase
VTELSVGILTADLLRLGQELDAVARAGVTRIHVDVMDGVFCPQTTVGPPVVRAIPDSFVKDVHLMIEDPVDKVAEYVAAGAGVVTFHVESTRHPHRVLQTLAGSGVVRGVALNPGTPLGAVEPLLDDLELLLVLAVNPGWSGQQFIPATERKLADARALIGGREIALAVDGGITKENVERVASLGVDVIVTGSAVFDGVAPTDNARRMLEAVRGAGNQPALVAGADPEEGE